MMPVELLCQHLATSFTPSLHINVRSDEIIVLLEDMLRTVVFDSVVAARIVSDFSMMNEDVRGVRRG